jgi:hypothetical protein
MSRCEYESGLALTLFGRLRKSTVRRWLLYRNGHWLPTRHPGSQCVVRQGSRSRRQPGEAASGCHPCRHQRWHAHGSGPSTEREGQEERRQGRQGVRGHVREAEPKARVMRGSASRCPTLFFRHSFARHVGLASGPPTLLMFYSDLGRIFWILDRGSARWLKRVGPSPLFSILFLRLSPCTRPP